MTSTLDDQHARALSQVIQGQARISPRELSGWYLATLKKLHLFTRLLTVQIRASGTFRLIPVTTAQHIHYAVLAVHCLSFGMMTATEISQQPD